MKVLLFGATGFTGKAVLAKLLDSNHIVTALVRSKARVSLSHPNLRLIEGDVLDQNLIDSAMEGQEAVINCLGKNKGSADNLISSLTEKIILAMEANKVSRLIALSNVGAGDSYQTQPWFFRAILLPTILKWLQRLIEDKNIMEPMIKKSSLNWTILRFPNISDKKPKNRTLISQDGRGLSFSISLKECADFIVAQLVDQSLWFKTPSISN
ncbi:MAG: NAD(P)-binding oxidoreductase [Bacteroidota bacterium]